MRSGFHRPRLGFDFPSALMFYKQNKYGARKQDFNGRMYHSGFEAGIAAELELARRATKKEERVVEIVPQFSITFWIGRDGKIDDVQTTGAIKIIQYRPDFLVTYADGHKELIEAKGMETRDFTIKWRLTEALYSSKYPDVKLILMKDARRPAKKFGMRFKPAVVSY